MPRHQAFEIAATTSSKRDTRPVPESAVCGTGARMRLESYVGDLVSVGYSREEVVRALTSAGVEPSDIEDLVRNLPSRW